MDLDVQQQSDKVYKDINEDQTPPLRMGFIPSLLKLIKQSWAIPSSVQQISRRVKILYKTHSGNTVFLSKHPPPNSVIVDAIQNRAKNQSNATPNNKEGKKLNIIDCWVYSLSVLHIACCKLPCSYGSIPPFTPGEQILSSRRFWKPLHRRR